MRLSGNCTVVSEVMVIVPESPLSSTIVPFVFGEAGESVRVMLVTAPWPVKATENVPDGGFGPPEAMAEPCFKPAMVVPSTVAKTVMQPVKLSSAR